VIGDLLFGLILDLIPEKIRKVAGIILIIIGVIISLIAIPFSLLLMTEDTDFGLFIAVLSAIPIVLSFLFGFLLISGGSEWGSRNVSLLD
jgi:TRAP-type C4-dicarboxylate transport system permease small subunit